MYTTVLEHHTVYNTIRMTGAFVLSCYPSEGTLVTYFTF
jgi:hypothetical protein